MSTQQYSQHGEDAYLASLFPANFVGTCVEVGAYDGVSLSNTMMFEKLGWDCLCIEPIPESFQKCQQVRKRALNVAIGTQDQTTQTFSVFTLMGNNKCAISGLEPDARLIQSHAHMIQQKHDIEVSVRSLTAVLDEAKFPTTIDFISIDTENTEIDVLKSLDMNKYLVRVFIIENNFNEPQIEEYLKPFGYTKIHRLAVNDFYVHSSFTPTNLGKLM
jgi:FkbM family methyltransferase